MRFLLIFPVCFRVAPFFPGLSGVVIQFCTVKRFKIHIDNSCSLNLTGVENQFVQVIPFQFQQPDLPGQNLGSVQLGIVQNLLDFFQGKLQFPEQ